MPERHERLSENQLSRSYDVGHRSLPMPEYPDAGFLAGVDLQGIAASPEAKQLVQSLPPQVVFFSIRRDGLDASLAVLPYLSAEQVTKLMDYDVWQGDKIDRLRFSQWMLAFNTLSENALYERFGNLEEEYQLAFLEGLVRVYSEEEKDELPIEDQDQLFVMPCGKVFYQILADDDNVVSAIQALIESAKASNMNYAYALLRYPQYIPPGETAHLLSQFRKGRLEDDGFVDPVESQKLFLRFDRDMVAKKYQSEQSQSGQALVPSGEDDFLQSAFAALAQNGVSIDEQYELHTKLLYLANALSSASQVEPGDIAGLRVILAQMKGLVSLGLEALSKGDLEVAGRILQSEHPSVLFQSGLSLVDDLRSEVASSILHFDASLGEKLYKYYQRRQWGLVLSLMDEAAGDILSYEMVESLKGLFNRYPLMLKKGKNARADKIVFTEIRGLVNFAEMRAQILSWCGLIGVAAKLNAADVAKGHIDLILSTAMARFATSGELSYAPLSKDLWQNFCDVKSADLQMRKKALMTEMIEDALEVISGAPSELHKASGLIQSYLEVLWEGLMQAKGNGLSSFVVDLEK
jgi:hypothetical protein